jgi:Cu-processing system permease protein
MALFLFLLFQLADYPIEKAMLAVTALNPIDLARIVILLQMDISALMGYTGAIFRDVFGNFSGVLIAFAILVLWAIIPLLLSVRKFNKKDL